LLGHIHPSKFCFLEGLKEVWGIVSVRRIGIRPNKSIKALEVAFDAITNIH
jgi:hypothetical protein